MASDPVAGALGDMGLWQLRGVLLVALVKVPSAWFMASILFIAPTPRPGQFWCARPTPFKHWSGERWLSAAHPPHARLQGRKDMCNMYDATSGEWDVPSNSSPFTNISVVPCTRFEFQEGPEAPYTIVNQWHLVCQKEVLVGVSQLFYLLGMLCGGVICFLLLSRYSPKKLLLAGMVLQLVAGVSTAYSPFFELHLALRFLTAVAFVTLITCGYVICTDITGGAWRTVVGAFYESFWSIGILTLPFLYSLFLDWRDLQVTLSLPTLLLLLLYRWMPDSPRWLLAHGYEEEAQEILKKAALFNGREIPGMDPSKKTIPSSHGAARAGWASLLRPPNSRLKVCSLHVLWMASVVCYYGGLLNVRNLGDRFLTNTVVAGVAEIVGMLLALRLIWCDKKWLALGLLLIVGGTMPLLCWILPLNAPWTRTGGLVTLAMMNRVPVACSLNVLQVGSSQLFEQEFRPVAMLSSITFARLFLLSAPFIAGSASMFGEYASLSIFAVLTLVGGIASLLLEYACTRHTKYKCSPAVPATADKNTNWAVDVPLKPVSKSADSERKVEPHTISEKRNESNTESLGKKTEPSKQGPEIT